MIVHCRQLRSWLPIHSLSKSRPVSHVLRQTMQASASPSSSVPAWHAHVQRNRPNNQPHHHPHVHPHHCLHHHLHLHLLRPKPSLLLPHYSLHLLRTPHLLVHWRTPTFLPHSTSHPHHQTTRHPGTRSSPRMSRPHPQHYLRSHTPHFLPYLPSHPAMANTRT